MKKSRKKLIVAILLVTMLSQTLYSAAASVFGLSTRSYAYADDEMTEEVEPGEEVDESTQDDKDIVQEAPDESTDKSSDDTEETYIEEEADTRAEADSEDELIEDEENVNEETVPEIRLRASYVDSNTGSAIKDTEDLGIDTNYMYILEYEAPEITDYTYTKTTINIEGKEYKITAILTGEKNGTEVYSITTDNEVKDKSADEVSWTELVKDAVIVMNYDTGAGEPEEAVEEEETVSDNEAETEDEAVSDNEVSENAVSENEVDEEAEKREYEYEDDYIYAKATLERADAIPDDAVFIVTDVTGSSEAEDAVDKADEATETDLDKETARVYDIHFENEELGEIEPEEGSVTIEIRFKRNVIAPESDEEADDRELVLVHVADDGEAEEIQADISDTDNGVSSVSFDTDSLSLYVLGQNAAEVKRGTSYSIGDMLGKALYYGVTANELTLGGHMDTNFAVGKLTGGNNTTQGAYTGSHNPGNDIIASYDTSSGSGWYADVSGGKEYTIVTTPEVAN
ncbi:MAG: hypothetical protein IJ641_04900, partial [Lachnospiraceae bacterium]|nr:hypothetical protein [Lachnospiraceae bacterium]